jgi:hypothetical protein
VAAGAAGASVAAGAAGLPPQALRIIATTSRTRPENLWNDGVLLRIRETSL